MTKANADHDPPPTLDVILVIGEGIASMNRCLADTSPTAAGYEELEAERDRAIQRLHLLVQIFTKTSTHRFVDADSSLATINADLKKIADDLERLQDMIDTATRFVSAIDSIITSISKIV